MRNETAVRRVALGIAALAATLLLGGAGAGFAGADPDPADPPPDPGPTSEPGVGGEPAPTAVPSVAPKTPLSQLRDLLRSRVIFGSGRVPGQAPSPKPDSGPKRKPDPTLEPPERPGSEPVGGSAPVAIPLPTFPGMPDVQYPIDPRTPQSPYVSVQETFSRLGAMAVEALAPFYPTPPPKPRPTMKIAGEEPVIDSAGGGSSGDGFGLPEMSEMSASMPELPVLQAPAAFPGRLGVPRPLAEVVPVGMAPRVVGEGSAGAGAPAGRGSVTQGSVQAAEVPRGSAPASMGNASTGNLAYRQGFPQYLRSARVGELATVALPGVAGLLAITASGGVIGYRQANWGRRLRADAERFMR